MSRRVLKCSSQFILFQFEQWKRFRGLLRCIITIYHLLKADLKRSTCHGGQKCLVCNVDDVFSWYIQFLIFTLLATTLASNQHEFWRILLSIKSKNCAFSSGKPSKLHPSCVCVIRREWRDSSEIPRGTGYIDDRKDESAAVRSVLNCKTFATQKEN